MGKRLWLLEMLRQADQDTIHKQENILVHQICYELHVNRTIQLISLQQNKLQEYIFFPQKQPSLDIWMVEQKGMACDALVLPSRNRM